MTRKRQAVEIRAAGDLGVTGVVAVPAQPVGACSKGAVGKNTEVPAENIEDGNFHDRRPVEIEGDDLTDENLATPMKLTERYCVVYQTLKSTPPIEVNAVTA